MIIIYHGFDLNQFQKKENNIDPNQSIFKLKNQPKNNFDFFIFFFQFVWL